MDTVIRAVYWFLAGVAAAALVAAAVIGARTATREKATLRVVRRDVQVEVRQIPTRRSPSRKMPHLHAVATLHLDRLDRAGGYKQTDVRIISKDEFVTGEYLDRWRPGETIQAALTGNPSNPVDLSPPKLWQAVIGPILVAWFFGCFAWIAARPNQNITVKMLSMAGVPALAGLAVVLPEVLAQPPARTAVQGFSRSQSTDELIELAEAQGVRCRANVREHLGAENRHRFCEYAWNGAKLRTTSTWCQPPEGETCPGRLNALSPRDVKWGDEPD